MISLSGYQIFSKIYDSINSEVYRAIREIDQQTVILKVLKQDYPTPTELIRYKQEYELTISLNIEGVIKVYSLEKYQNTLIIILEDFGGESWRKYGQYSQFNLQEFLSIAIKISTSLAQIHAANIIHKDINPANIVINPEIQKVKIIDFGISTKLTRENPTLKNPHVLEGTLAYISPEQTGRMNRSLDYRTDFYSLGVTFYEMLTETLPFNTEDDLELVHCHIAKQPLSPTKFNPLIPSVISNIVLKLMSKNAEDRYQSAWGLKADLETCLHQLQSTGNIEFFTLGSQDISDKFQITQKLYGRDTEIKTLLTAFERVSNPSQSPLLRGEKGGIELMLISGYSGIGKSALVQEIYKPITETKGYFISGKFDQFQRNIPYIAIINSFKQLVKQILTESDDKLQIWKNNLLTALGVNAQVIIDVIPEIELIIGKQQSVPELGGNEAQNRFNLTFQNFINICCAKEHPLVIFLDDLQWADGATLKLIELMMKDTNLSYLFLICAYRNNEVSQGHPLLIMLDELRKSSVIINELILTNLQKQDISNIIADTLKSDLSTVESLAELVLNKTGGNPFFVNQFFKTLYNENLINFHYNKQQWQWDINQISEQNITDNVVELMLGKLKKLPELTQQILQLAACVGANFDLHILSLIKEKTPTEIFHDLIAVIELGLILPLSELDSELLIQDYKFLHDRVQQAAYTLISELEKQETHLKIGRLLLINTPSDVIEDHIFDIVNQLNKAINIIDNPEEKITLAQLNLMAGRKAKANIAYEPAVQYLNIGLELLDHNSWETHYKLTLEIHESAAKAAYLNGDFDQMENMVALVDKFAKTMLEKVKVYEVKMLAYITRTKLLEAANIGLQALHLLGITLPESPTQDDIKQVFLETKNLLSDKSELELLNLPTLTDINKLAAMRILSVLFAPIFLSKPALLPFIPCQQVQLSLKYGNNSHSALGYANYAIILNGFLQELDSAYEFGQFALKLLSQVNSSEIKGRTLNQVATFTIHHKAHIKDTFPLFLESYQRSLETGDLEFVGYGAMNRCQNLYFGGETLILVEKEMQNYCHALAKFNLQTSLNYNQIFWQSVINLISPESNTGSLIGTACNEQEMLPILLNANDRFGIFSLYLHKLILYYLFNNYSEAFVNAKQAQQYVDGATGMVCVPVFYFYDSLARLAMYSSVSNEEQKSLLLKVQNNQDKMQHWANYAPMNYQHKFDLVEAEKYRILGENWLAMEMYDRAISGAKENDYINEEALGNELAAQFYFNLGKEKFAHSYIQEAHYSYNRWSAMAKVKHLEQKYPQLLILTSTSINTRVKSTITTRITTGSNADATLDFATVMKASQAISGEIVLEKLLIYLMQIIIQNAGAQLGYLLLETNNQLLIEAAGINDNITALQSISIDNYLPVSLINYVARLKEDIVLKDATGEGNFVNDPYIMTQKPKSILCTPLVNQGHLVGIVYLENNLTTGAFTPDRLEVIKLLSGQAAIALENARLYQTLEDKVIERTTQLAEANNEISTLNQKLKAENLRLSAELDVAKKLQEMVLPKSKELEAIAQLDIAGYMVPADEVGGDYYDVLSSENGVKIAIGDVTGHGLESGVLMLMAQTAIRTLQKMNETDPVRFLDMVNQTLYDNLQRMGSEKNMSLAILDYVDGEVKLSGQHEEIIIVRSDGNIEKIDTIDLGFPIGLDDQIADFISQQTIRLNPEDLIVLYTDGITEAENMSKQQYGLDKLCQIVRENRHKSSGEIRENVINDLQEFIRNQKVFDDITLVILKQK